MSDKKISDFYKAANSSLNKYKNVFLDICDVKSANADHSLPLSNKLISIKANIDLEGMVSNAGSKILASNKRAEKDAPCVEKLKNAGGSIMGHTNMTELAYSGLGLNPHYGTPQNYVMPECAPGGSSAGAAVSVASGMVDIAIGTDTSGSVRIPAAFNRLVGYKPTKDSVSLKGVVPLSSINDSVGPMAHSIEDCHKAWQAMAEVQPSDIMERDEKVHFVIPKNFGFEDLDFEVKYAFNHAVKRLEASGHKVETIECPIFEKFKNLPIWQFSAYEAYHYFLFYIESDPEELDQRVLSRILRVKEFSKKEFNHSKNLRELMAEEYQEFYHNKVVIMPTVAILPPKLVEIENFDKFNEKNILALRNAGSINALNGCSISLPITEELPIGLMLSMAAFKDETLFSIAKQIEKEVC